MMHLIDNNVNVDANIFDYLSENIQIKNNYDQDVTHLLAKRGNIRLLRGFQSFKLKR